MMLDWFLDPSSFPFLPLITVPLGEARVMCLMGCKEVQETTGGMAWGE